MPKPKSYPYNDCRDLRHAWKRLDDELMEDSTYFTRTVECIRCGTRRVDVYQVAAQGKHLMFRVGSHYIYAEGYQVKGGFDVAAMRWNHYHHKPKKFRIV